MKTGFGDGSHKELLTIALALIAGSSAVIARSGFDGVTIGMLGVGLICMGIGVRLYFFHTTTVQKEAEAERALTRERDNLREVPRLAGEWSYVVKNSSVKNQKQMHSGKCEIKPDFTGAPRSFKLYGTRLKHWDEGHEPTSCSVDWESTWCEFTDEGKLRLAYDIEFEEETLQGFARLEPSGSPEVTTLKGKYSLYAPDGNRRTKGTITFQRNT